MRGPFSALKFRSTRHIATRHGHTQKKEGRNVCVIPLPPTKDSGNKRQFSKMVISAGLKQEQRAPSSYLKAINAPYRPYYISLTFSPFIYIARDFFFVLFCYCFLLSCVKARAALNFFFFFPTLARRVDRERIYLSREDFFAAAGQTVTGRSV